MQSPFKARNKLPLDGFSMLHFDSHPDMCASTEFRKENLENAEKMREKVSIESWILPLVVAGHLKVRETSFLEV